MIYTVTFNPAIDCVIRLDSLNSGAINRADRQDIFVGGKGINVSLVLNQLGEKSVAMGFSAGFTGAAIEDGVRAQGVETDFIRLEKGYSRINMKVKTHSETELNGPGPEISDEAFEKLMEKLDRLAEGDVLVLAGSVPSSLPRDVYRQIIGRLNGKGIKFVVDAAGDLLMNVLQYKPFLIKPNDIELGEIFNITLKSCDDVVSCARKLQEMGAVNVLVSMAEDGAVLIDENGMVHRIDAPKGKAVNSVGAGDSMVAGFLAGYLKTGDYSYALKLGTAAGSATAFSADLAKRDEIEKLFAVI